MSHLFFMNCGTLVLSTFLFLHNLALLSCFVFVASEMGGFSCNISWASAWKSRQSFFLSSSVALWWSKVQTSCAQGWIQTICCLKKSKKESESAYRRLLAVSVSSAVPALRKKKESTSCRFHTSADDVECCFWKTSGQFTEDVNDHFKCTSQKGPEDWGQRSGPSKRTLSFPFFQFGCELFLYFFYFNLFKVTKCVGVVSVESLLCLLSSSPLHSSRLQGDELLGHSSRT